MDYVIHLLAFFIVIGFLLKIGFYPHGGVLTAAIGCAVFAWLVTPWMTEQSKTVMETFFASRARMLDVSVCITLEVAIMIAFCFDCFSEKRSRDTLFNRIASVFRGA